jgi:hypothetical protein
MPWSALFKQTLDLTWRVEKVNKDGSASVSLSISRWKQEALDREGKWERLDTDTPISTKDYNSRQQHNAMVAMTREPVSLRITSDGRISDASLGPKVKSMIEKNVPPRFRDNAVKSIQEDFLSPLRWATSVLPSEPVTKQGAWKTSFSDFLPKYGNQKMTVTGRIVTDRTNVSALGRVRISFEVDYNLDPASIAEASEVPLRASEFKQLKQSCRGTAVFNLVNGCLESAELADDVSWDHLRTLATR